MAVVSFAEHWEGRGGESAGLEKTSATRTWKIRTDNKFDDENTIIATGLLPQYRSTHPRNIFLTCRSLRIDQEAISPYAWRAVATYSSEPEDQEERDRDEQPNPLLRPAKISWNTNRYMRVVERDVDGNAVINSAGDYFDPPPEEEVELWVATVRKNIASVPSWLRGYRGAKNSSSFEIDGETVSADKAKVADMSIGEYQTENDVQFRELVLSLEIWDEDDQETWDLVLLDQGLRYINGEGDRVNIKDDAEELVTQPKLLDGDGGILASPGPATAVFLSFETRKSKDFSVLPLT